eukprot:gene8948-biopygen317
MANKALRRALRTFYLLCAVTLIGLWSWSFADVTVRDGKWVQPTMPNGQWTDGEKTIHKIINAVEDNKRCREQQCWFKHPPRRNAPRKHKDAQPPGAMQMAVFNPFIERHDRNAFKEHMYKKYDSRDMWIWGMLLLIPIHQRKNQHPKVLRTRGI